MQRMGIFGFRGFCSTGSFQDGVYWDITIADVLDSWSDLAGTKGTLKANGYWTVTVTRFPGLAQLEFGVQVDPDGYAE